MQDGHAGTSTAKNGRVQTPEVSGGVELFGRMEEKSTQSSYTAIFFMVGSSFPSFGVTVDWTPLSVYTSYKVQLSVVSEGVSKPFYDRCRLL